jgi:uncharacterized membrane protein
MRWLPEILSLMIGAAGWFYLFYSRAAHHLTGVENQRNNVRRIRLRRITALVLLLLAVCFYAAFQTLDEGSSPRLFLILWGTVLILLMLVLVLGMFDVHYTMQFYRDRQQQRKRQ